MNAAVSKPSDIDARVALAESIGELLAIAPTLDQPPVCETLLHNLKLCVRELAGGSMNRFVAAAGISYDILMDWDRIPERNVRLIHLCRMYMLVGISPRLFFASIRKIWWTGIRVPFTQARASHRGPSAQN